MNLAKFNQYLYGILGVMCGITFMFSFNVLFLISGLLCMIFMEVSSINQKIPSIVQSQPNQSHIK